MEKKKCKCQETIKNLRQENALLEQKVQDLLEEVNAATR